MSNRLHNISACTMDDIARELGLSKSTVSRALSDSGRISQATKDKVKECAQRRGFKPNLVAKALAGQKTLNLAAVMPMEATAFQMLFFHECLSGIVSRSARDGYSVTVCMTEGSNGDILQNAVENRRLDAAILTQLKHNDKNVALLKKAGLPFVVIGQGAGEDVIHVDSRMKENCADFTCLCVKDLPENSRVLFVCGSLDIEANNNRLSGFLNAMESLSAYTLNYAVCTESSDVKDEISLGNWDLILCSDDVVCLDVLKVLAGQNLKPGKDVKIAAFHDSLLLESSGITALHVDGFKLGEAAASLALEKLSGRESETMHYVDCEFIMRDSTKD